MSARALLKLLWSIPILVGVAAHTASADRVPRRLLDRAAAGERVRVIVELEEATLPEGWLPDRASRYAQRARIARSQSRLRAALAAADQDAGAVREYRGVPFVALEVGPRALALLERRTDVRRVREDRLSRPFLNASVPYIGGFEALAAGYDGTGKAVVIIDSGVDGNHQNLVGKIVAEACFADGSSFPTSRGDCPNDGNSQIGPGSGVACDTLAECFHGTHVAGIAAGSGPEHSGVAPGADIISIQVFSYFNPFSCPGSEPCLLSWDSDQDLALQHVYDTLRHSHDIAAVNMSLGADAYDDPADCDAERPSTKALIDQLRSVGIATVISSGNGSCGGVGCSGQISLPACISSAVSVGATRNISDFAPDFGNKASFMSLYAPGQGIRAPLYETTDQYLRENGTSMSAPHVAGAFAIVHQAVSGLSVDAALANFQSTGAVVGNGLGPNRVDVEAALDGLGITDCDDNGDNDGDGLTNLDDPGCDDPSDPSEQSAALECDNGIDDDFDSFVDLDDPGCKDPTFPTESPACDDGIDNDGDGGIDWDGSPVDEDCKTPYRTTESRTCGLGAELALVVVPWGLWRSRRRSRATG